jgi:hypothetical protein
MNRTLPVAVMTLAFAAISSALAGPRDDIINEMIRCANIADAAARHACFDAAIPELKAASQTAPVGETPATPQVAEAQPDSGGGWLSGLNPFGGADRAPTQQQMAYQPLGAEILPLTIGVADYTTGPQGYTVTLDNGQVWQNYPRLVQAPPFNAAEKNIVTIDRAMLGGYNLTLRGHGKLYKVVRVK